MSAGRQLIFTRGLLCPDPVFTGITSLDPPSNPVSLLFPFYSNNVQSCSVTCPEADGQDTLNHSVTLFSGLFGSLRSEAAENWDTCFNYDTETLFLLSREKFYTRNDGGGRVIIYWVQRARTEW